MTFETTEHDTQISFAGINVPVIFVNRHTHDMGWFKNIQSAFLSLLAGMKVTFRYLSHPSTVVTQQYPENRQTLVMHDRYRSQLKFIYDEKNNYLCTGCKTCAMVCPNASITVIDRKGEISQKKELDRFIWRWDSCTFCNACVWSCPHGAIEFGKEFEASVFDRRLLVYQLNPYAGPSARILEKCQNAEEANRMKEPRERYSGPLPLDGNDLPGVNGLKKTDQEKK